MVQKEVRGPSGLRARSIMHRVEIARDIVRDVARREIGLHEYRLKDALYARLVPSSSGSRISKKTTDPTTAFHGGFEIHDMRGRVAFIHLRRSGKPVIHVAYGNAELGKRIAKAFKEQANFVQMPKVKPTYDVPRADEVLDRETRMSRRADPAERERKIRDAVYREAEHRKGSAGVEYYDILRK